MTRRHACRVGALVLTASLIAVGCSGAGATRSTSNSSSSTSVRAAAATPPTAPPAPTTTTTPPVHPRRTLTPRTPLRVTLVGDSVASTLAPGIDRALVSAGLGRLHSSAFPGFGLTSPWPGIIDGKPWAATFTNWPTVFSDAVAHDDPDVVVVLLGGWDLVERTVDGKQLAPFTPEWRAWFDGRLDDALRRLSARGAVIEWLSLPCDPRPDTNARIGAMNAVFDALPARWPGTAEVLPFEEFLCPGDHFAQTQQVAGGSTVDVWSPTMHFTDPGATFAGRWIVDQLLRTWRPST